jgi:hypothetical protein
MQSISQEKINRYRSTRGEANTLGTQGCIPRTMHEHVPCTRSKLEGSRLRNPCRYETKHAHPESVPNASTSPRGEFLPHDLGYPCRTHKPKYQIEDPNRRSPDSFRRRSPLANQRLLRRGGELAYPRTAGTRRSERSRRARRRRRRRWGDRRGGERETGERLVCRRLPSSSMRPSQSTTQAEPSYAMDRW